MVIDHGEFIEAFFAHDGHGFGGQGVGADAAGVVGHHLVDGFLEDGAVVVGEEAAEVGVGEYAGDFAGFIVGEDNDAGAAFDGALASCMTWPTERESEAMGRFSPRRKVMASPTLRSLRPSWPAGWKRAKSSGLKLRSFITVRARASQRASSAVVEAAGG